ncbi:MAG: hypothetical protein KDA80_04490 [Planctomycetaceae bacterium]|nr:hypothetical protein [Planctomycetaceae bacterium]
MTTWGWLVLGLVMLLTALAVAVVAMVRARQMQSWIGSYVWPTESVKKWHSDDEIDVFIAVCDHWEPRCYGASDEEAAARANRWRDEYPKFHERFQDVNGRFPQHTFFFPEDEYRPEYLDALRPLVDAGFGDVEVHLHHHDDTAAELHEKLDSFRRVLFDRHGFLRQDPQSGEILYAFIHGNWALCNSRADGKLCGVDQELTVLLNTGCYADLTLPSAPSATQTRTINSIYYAKDIPGQRKSHNTGVRARVGQAPPADHLLMIQGPLTLDWGSRRHGLIPRIENSDLHGGRPASIRRLKMWMNAGVCVAGRTDWRFVKLHTHGCKDDNINTFLGPEMQPFHEGLAELHRRHPNFRYHYVTAWDMAQLVHRAENREASPMLVTTPTVLQRTSSALLNRN